MQNNIDSSTVHTFLQVMPQLKKLRNLYRQSPCKNLEDFTNNLVFLINSKKEQQLKDSVIILPLTV